MKTGEILSLISLIVSVCVFVTGTVVFIRNIGKDKADEGERTAKIESKLDFIKIQTELINAQYTSISGKLDSHGDRLIAVEQIVAAARLSEIPAQLARMDESIKIAHKRIGEIGKKMKNET